jgi:hypothetical protein
MFTGQIFVCGSYINDNSSEHLELIKSLVEKITIFMQVTVQQLNFGTFPFLIKQQEKQFVLVPNQHVKDYTTVSFWLSLFQKQVLDTSGLYIVGRIGYYSKDIRFYTGLIYITKHGYLWTKVADISSENLEHYLEFYDNEAQECFEYCENERFRKAVEVACDAHLAREMQLMTVS